LVLSGCATANKLNTLKKDGAEAQIEVSSGMAKHEDLSGLGKEKRRDTLTVHDVDGKQFIVMKTVTDENGEQVASQVLDAAVVSARFRNVAERHGRINLEFQVMVPSALQDSKWQLRYCPTMYILSDTVALDSIIITGKDYRRKQMKGYELYERFLAKIITDSSKFIDSRSLEIFLKRNIPELYAFRSDSSYVNEEDFLSVFGVSEKEAIDHYTDRVAEYFNDKRIRNKDAKFRKFVKAPYIRNGIRLDTVMVDSNGDYIYNYTQTIHSRPKLKKVDITVDGSIYDQDVKLLSIARSKPLTFYISSVSAFVDDSERYLTKIIERKAQASCSYDIEFNSGKSNLDPDIGDNRSQLSEVRSNLLGLMVNDIFELDSLIITASSSPEGAKKYNYSLSQKRSESICSYLNGQIRKMKDSLNRVDGLLIDESGRISRSHNEKITLVSASIGEDWVGLDSLIKSDSRLSGAAKADYFSIRDGNFEQDEQERVMAKRPWYSDVRSRIYPQLRRVEFSFNMHRKAMTKDTIHTTVIDTLYMEGVQAIKDRDYNRAIEILRPYNDYNTAVAYCAGDFNWSALAILKDCPKDARVNYMLALISSRLGQYEQAVEYYLRSCSQDVKYVHRGNLDPEISALIEDYGLNAHTAKLLDQYTSYDTEGNTVVSYP